MTEIVNIFLFDNLQGRTVTRDYSHSGSIELSSDDGEPESPSPRRMDSASQLDQTHFRIFPSIYIYHWTEKKSLVVWQFVVEIKDVFIAGRGW